MPPLTPAANPEKDEMSPALKELAKKSYLVIKHKILPKEYQTKGGFSAKLSTNSQEYFENRVSLLLNNILRVSYFALETSSSLEECLSVLKRIAYSYWKGKFGTTVSPPMKKSI